jgi:hypothetical protein
MIGRCPTARCSLAGGPEGAVFLQPLAEGPVHTEWLFHCFTHGYMFAGDNFAVRDIVAML